MNQDSDRKAVIYCRVASVSSETLAQELDQQEASCRALATRSGWEVTAVFHDVGRLPQEETRPGFAAMLRRIAETPGKTVILVDGLERLARDVTGHRNALTAIEGVNAELEVAG